MSELEELRRVTITIDSAIDRKVRMKQARRIRETGKSYSYSKAVGELLEEALR